MITQSHLLFLDSKGNEPVTAEASPILKPLKICSRLAEELKLHLLELTCSEGEVTRCKHLTESLTNLSNTEWNLFT